MIISATIVNSSWSGQVDDTPTMSCQRSIQCIAFFGRKARSFYNVDDLDPLIALPICDFVIVFTCERTYRLEYLSGNWSVSSPHALMLIFSVYIGLKYFSDEWYWTWRSDLCVWWKPARSTTQCQLSRQQTDWDIVRPTVEAMWLL